ncbi:MAG: hypothetical protein M3N68_07525, partial [Actinomycetota bacterium]|nr:hypothetical protein [Actinomycetota bacterium]
MRRLLVVSLLIAQLVVLERPAQAQSALERATTELRRDPVYVDPAAERSISPDAADRLRQRIRQSGTPVFVAVLPGAAVTDAGGDPARLPAALGEAVGLQGTYAVVAGNSFRAGSTVLPRGRASSLATASFQARSGDGTDAVLGEFVDRVAQADRGGSEAGPVSRSERAREDGGGGGGGGGGLALLALLGVAGGGFLFWQRGRRQREDQEARQDLEADRQMLQAELSVLADDVMALEHQVTLHPDARPDYDAGVNRFRAAEAALQYADDEVDLVRVERVIAEGRYAMNRARARVEGREPPPPPTELARPGRHDEPALEVDERGEPVYAGYGGPFYGGGGWFGGGGGGLLTGLLLGQMLGGGWGGWGGNLWDNDDRGGGY